MAKLVCLMRLGWFCAVACWAVGCGSDSEEPAEDDAGATNATTSTSSGTTATATSGNAESVGVVVDGTCKLRCADDSTDADTAGVSDGWGFEAGQSCVVPGGMADTGEGCSDPVLAEGPESASTPGTGVLINGMCTLVCADASTDADSNGATDGWGYERGVSCVVSGGTSDPGAEAEACTEIPPEPGASTPGGSVQVGDTCFAVCLDDSTDADAAGISDGWGYEDDVTCVVPGGAQDTGMPCE